VTSSDETILSCAIAILSKLSFYSNTPYTARGRLTELSLRSPLSESLRAPQPSEFRVLACVAGEAVETYNGAIQPRNSEWNPGQLEPESRDKQLLATSACDTDSEIGRQWICPGPLEPESESESFPGHLNRNPSPSHSRAT
jgi:hypothetical protein